MTQGFRFLKLGQAADGTEDESVRQLLQGVFINDYLVILVPEAPIRTGTNFLLVIRILSRILH